MRRFVVATALLLFLGPLFLRNRRRKRAAIELNSMQRQAAEVQPISSRPSVESEQEESEGDYEARLRRIHENTEQLKRDRELLAKLEALGNIVLPYLKVLVCILAPPMGFLVFVLLFILSGMVKIPWVPNFINEFLSTMVSSAGSIAGIAVISFGVKMLADLKIEYEVWLLYIAWLLIVFGVGFYFIHKMESVPVF